MVSVIRQKNVVAEALNGVLETIYKIDPDIMLTTKFEFDTKKVMDMSIEEAAKYLTDITTFANKVIQYQTAVALILGSVSHANDVITEEKAKTILGKLAGESEDASNTEKKPLQKQPQKQPPEDDEEWEEEEW